MKMCFQTKLCCDDDKLYEEKEKKIFFLEIMICLGVENYCRGA
jgi:hypothetical protein